MPQERFYLNAPLKENESYLLTEGELHHLAHVTRGKVGDEVELINGKGHLAEAVIESLEKKQARLKVIRTKEVLPPKTKIILALAYPRANRLDTILEKCTELGVTDIWLFPGEKSERKEASMARIESILTSALKQCGGLFLPTLTQMPPIREWQPLPYPLYFGDFSPDAPHMMKAMKGGSSIIVIGPESGLTDRETEKLRELGGQGVTLHPNVLRVDTAAIAAVAFASVVAQSSSS